MSYRETVSQQRFLSNIQYETLKPSRASDSLLPLGGDTTDSFLARLLLVELWKPSRLWNVVPLYLFSQSQASREVHTNGPFSLPRGTLLIFEACVRYGVKTPVWLFLQAIIRAPCVYVSPGVATENCWLTFPSSCANTHGNKQASFSFARSQTRNERVFFTWSHTNRHFSVLLDSLKYNTVILEGWKFTIKLYRKDESALQTIFCGQMI